MSFTPENETIRQYIDMHTANLESLPTDDAMKLFRCAVRTTYVVLNDIESNLSLTKPQKQIILDLVDISRQTLRSEVYLHSATSEDVLLLANKWISDFSQRVHEHLFPVTVPEFNINRISLEKIEADHPEKVKLIPAQNFDGRILEISHLHQRPTQIPLSDNFRFWYRGGACRTALKIAVGAPNDLLDAELPVHDLDIGLPIDSSLLEERFVRSLGIDAGSIEYCRGQILHLPTYFYSRDITLNQAVLTSTELIFTNEARLAALTGHIVGVCGMTPERALYGPDMYYKDGKHLYLARGLSRVVKSVAEGKANSFQYYPENKADNVRPYVLFLLRRWSYRDDYPMLAGKLFSLMQQMGQTLPDEHTTVDLIRNCMNQDHDQNYYSLNSDEVTFRWKITKLRRQLYRIFDENDQPLSQTEGQTVGGEPVTISIGNYERNEEEEKQVLQLWNKHARNSQN